MSFEKGDVVQLKSGGPAMTVTAIMGQEPLLDRIRPEEFTDGDVTVEYFNGNKLEKGMFRKTSLEKL